MNWIIITFPEFKSLLFLPEYKPYTTQLSLWNIRNLHCIVLHCKIYYLHMRIQIVSGVRQCLISCIFILRFVDRASLCNLANKANLVHNFSNYVYFFSLHASGDYVPIIRRNNCIYATLGTCYSVWMIVWYAGWNEIPPCIPHSHLYRITSTKCHINTVVSPDDGHIIARSM
jgi:hypothetical protein